MEKDIADIYCELYHEFETDNNRMPTSKEHEAISARAEEIFTENSISKAEAYR